MKHKRFSQILVISVVSSLLVATVISVHRYVKSEISARSDHRLCLQALPNRPPQCYNPATVISQEAVTALATSPDETLLASSTGKTIHIWDLRSLQQVRSLTGHQNWIAALVFSPDGALLASSSLDRTIRLWDLNTGTLKATLRSNQIVTTLAFSPNRQILATGSRLQQDNQPISDNSIQFWNLKTRLVQQEIQNEPTHSLSFSPDGQWLATGMQDTRLWQLPEGSLQHTVRSHNLNALLFSPDSKTLITGSNGIRGENGMNFWEVESGTLTRTVNSVAVDLALTADGKMLASTLGGNVNLWHIQPPGYVGALRGSDFSAMFVRFGLNGRRIITGSSDGIRVWKEEE